MLLGEMLMVKTSVSDRQQRHNVAGGHGLYGGELQWRSPPLPADGAKWMGHRCKCRLASPASSSATGEVDESTSESEQLLAGGARGAVRRDGTAARGVSLSMN
jgi:hypothetical protein